MGQQKKKDALPVASSFDEIMATHDLPEGDPLEIPEWGMAVVVRGLPRGVVSRILSDEVDQEEGNAIAVSEALVSPKLTIEEARALLSAKGAAPTQRIIDAIVEKSGMGAQFRSQ